jgi:serine/threonine protein kinase
MGCMAEKGDLTQCPSCGWVEGSEPESPQHLKPGTILQGKYLVGRALGQGGFGITYLGWDVNLKLRLAIKEYLPQDLASRTPGHTQVSVYTSQNYRDQFEYGLEKFLQEAQTLAQFEGHPNIVSVRDFFRENDTAYIVMSYVEGITLKEHLALSGNIILVDKALSIIMPVLDALVAVHEVGILHRDISPDNIFINHKGQVILIDFGAARQSIGEKGHSLSVILKPGFAPEEQHRSKGVQGPWTDIYAVAVTLYRMITGQMPPESLDRLVDDTLIPPSGYGIALSADQEAAILKAVAVRAEDRFRTVRDFQRALMGEKLAGETQAGAHSSPSPTPPPPPGTVGPSSPTPPPPSSLSGAEEAVRGQAPVAAVGQPAAKSKPKKALQVALIIAASFGLLFVILIIATIISDDSDQAGNTEPTYSVPGDYSTIQEAIEAAAAGSVITIEPGTYYENIDFKGKELTLKSINPDDYAIVESTIIDGGGKGSTVSIRNGEGQGTTLMGLHITGGTGGRESFDFDENGTLTNANEYLGGGILIMNGSAPTITQCIIRENYSTEAETGEGGGGGITIVANSSATISANLIDSNESDVGGGIVVAYNSSAVVRDNTISNNRSPSTGNADNFSGGVFVIYNSTATVENNTITANTSPYNVGGVMVMFNSVVTVKGNTITLNSGQSASCGVFVAGESDATIENNRINNNESAEMCGGVIVSEASTATVRNNNIDDNKAEISGGVIVIDNSNVTIDKNTIRSNLASSVGGGILIIDKATATVTNNILENNTAKETGGAITVDYTSTLNLDDPDSNQYSGNKPKDIHRE